MKKLDLRQIQMIELEILLQFAKFCDERGLRYYLAYGTLLGAVRHKGFIPWDDDIDVLMPREDYDILIREYPKSPPSHYRLVAPLDKISRHSFVKIMDTRTVKRENNFDYATGELGIDIDVFPLDGQPEDRREYEDWYEKLQRCYRKADFPVRLTYGGRRKRWLLKLVNGLGGREHLLGVAIKRHYLKKALRLHQRYPYRDCGTVGMAEHCFGCDRERYPADLFGETVLLEFEGHLLKAPAGFDALLRCTYGDYMQLPPEDKRVAHQIDEAYLKHT